MNKNRNRHTGHVNAFKAVIIKRGHKLIQNGKVYYELVVKTWTNRAPSITRVRVK